MADVKASDVKALRDCIGAGMMDCKKALVECNGNIEDAIDWLRKKGLAAAAKKSSRIAAEGLVGVAAEGRCGTIVEINAETDFVARNELFQKYVKDVARIAYENNCTLEQLKALEYPGTGHSISEELTNLIAVIGENMEIRRVSHLAVSNGVVSSYVHSKVAPTLGRIGVLVALESFGNQEKLLDLGKRIAMHIAASNPLSLSIADLDPVQLQRERDVVAEQARSTGKPVEFIEKIQDGRIRKFYEEVVLLEQIFVLDNNSRVKDVISAAAQDVGAPVILKGYRKFVLGEGIERQTVDFAADVAAQLK
ncbi:MAG: translation elongation factor Ts [Holosporaceae bacterium]|jgi:elongation factor Ts|nr:translation elongation factor Ts [Holosporaceae bacterium]